MRLTGLFFMLGACCMLLFSCSSQPENTEKEIQLLYFGDSISEDGAIDVASLTQAMGNEDSFEVKLTGTITDVCQKKGCWFEYKIGEQRTMRVTFKDYAFFIPKDASGKTAIVKGVATRDTISVEDLKHYAHDAGKSEDEIKKIVEPEIELTFEASGVIIKEEKK